MVSLRSLSTMYLHNSWTKRRPSIHCCTKSTLWELTSCLMQTPFVSVFINKYGRWSHEWKYSLTKTRKISEHVASVQIIAISKRLLLKYYKNQIRSWTVLWTIAGYIDAYWQQTRSQSLLRKIWRERIESREVRPSQHTRQSSQWHHFFPVIRRL